MNYKVYLSSSSKARSLKVVTESCLVAIEPEDFTAKQVAELKKRGYTVLGYMSIGSVSDERSYFKSLEPYILKDDKGHKKKLDDWPHEYFLDLRRTKARDWCIARAREIQKLGCDGWWLDNVDVYEECERSAMLEAITLTLKRIKGLGGYVMLNGGMAYLDKVMDTEFDKGTYKVQCGAFTRYENAENIQLELRKIGVKSIVKHGSDDLYRVQTGAFSEFSNAYKQLDKILSASIDAYIIIERADRYENPLSKYVDGVTQEEVLTKITDYSGKGKFTPQTAKQSEEYKQHMCRVKTHGMSTFLLEYSRDSQMVIKIKNCCTKYKFTGYYCSSDVNL